MANTWVMEIVGYDPDTSGTVTYRVAVDAYISGGNIYEPRILELPRFSRSVSAAIAMGGRGDATFGEAKLSNGDGALDAMRGDYFDGRTLTLKYGDVTTAWASLTTVLVAKISSIGFDGDIVSVRLTDRSNELEKAYSDLKYGGTNSLPNGVDGTGDDIKGQSRPLILGFVSHAPVVAVNTSKLIYEVSCTQLDYVINVFDAGSYLGRGSDYSSQSDMENNQPTQGAFRVWYGSTGTYIRLGSTPFGTVTVCAVDKWTHTQISAAGLLSRIFTKLGWVAGTDYVSADLTALDQKSCGPLGVMVQPDESSGSLIDRICQTVGAVWWFDALSRFRVARVDAPASPVATLYDYQFRDEEGQANESETPWRITMPADWNYTVTPKTSLAGIVQQNLARVAWYEAESRDQVASDAAVKTARLTAVEQRHVGYFTAISQGQAEATRRRDLLKPRRDITTITLLDWSTYSLDIVSTVGLVAPVVGYSSARNMLITRIDIDHEADSADLELWG